MDPEEVTDQYSDLIEPHELASFLSSVYRNEEASTFERTQAAVGLTSFWCAAEINRLIEMMTPQETG